MRLTIDGIAVEAAPGVSVLRAALDAGIYIPHLCYHPSLPAAGDCRLCLVEIEGMEGLQAACETAAAEGMVVCTHNEQIDRLRRLSVELMLAGHPEDCTGCPKYGQCELQTLIQYLGIGSGRLRRQTVQNDYTDANPLYIRDLSRCVLCGRCVRACQELRQVGVLDFDTSGEQVQVRVRGGGLLADGDCRFCGACVEVCPTGALMDKASWMERFPTREQNLVPCRSACPAGTDVPRYLHYIRRGEYANALAVIRERLPLPLTLGHICMRFCEDACRRGCINDPVSIRELKKVAAQRGGESWKAAVKPAEPTGKRAAIIGSGPAGLTAAYYLARKGHRVELFEKLPEPGGMLRYGIPGYRLPREVLDAEIADILGAGAVLHCGASVTPDTLRAEGYDAVVVAIGTHKGSRIPIPGHDLPGVTTAVDLLRAYEQGTAVVGKRVLVLGGGNVAFDAAGAAHRLGAQQMTMACLEPRDGMTASEEEVEEALQWGLNLYNRYGFKSIEPWEDALRVVCNPLDGDTEQSFVCDTVIFAVGQKPELEGFALPTERGLIQTEDGVTVQAGVFAAGDAVTGTASVVGAVAAGRTAAAAVDRYLGGDGNICEQLAPQDLDWMDPVLGRVPGFASLERECSCGENPSAEAERCLRCHLRLQLERPKRWSEYQKRRV